MLGSQRRTGLLGTAAAAVLLAMTLGLAGCGSDGDDGAQGPPGPPGPPGPGVDPVEPLTDVKQHMQLFGATMDGTGSHAGLLGEVTACSACHGGPGSALPFPEVHAQAVPAFVEASIEGVSVTTANPTEIEVTFEVDGYTDDSIDVEITLAKWLPERQTWINMLHRDRTRDVGARVIRAGNLRLAGDFAVGAEPPEGEDWNRGVLVSEGRFSTFIASPNADFGGPGPIDFSEAPVWRRDGNDQAETYCGDDDAYCDFVQEILDDIDAAGRWDDNATYRVGVTSRNLDVSRFNAIGYFTGNGVMVDNPNPVMSTASCAGCHGESVVLNVHGNQRHEPELCTTCHNQFTFDAAESTAEPDGWTNIDTPLMIHKLHAGIDGYRVDETDYSDVRYPDWLFGRGQGDLALNLGVSNCSSCHKDDIADETLLPGAKWNVVSNEACLTCHVGDTLSAAGFNPPHGNFVGEPASACAGCHGDGPGQFAPSANEFHGVTGALAEIEQRKDARVKIVSVTDAVAGQPAQVAWQVVDADGTPYSPLSDLNPTVNVGIGWGHGDDWVNDGIDRDNGARGDPWSFSVNDDEVDTVFNGDTATTTLPPLPPEAIAGRNAYAVVYGGGLSINGSDVRPNTAIATLTLGSDATDPVEGLPNERRQIVSSEGCLTCHTTVGRHGTVADDDIMGCVACHNAGSLSRDDSEIQGSVDFMFMLHAIHGIGDGKRERFDRRRDHGYLYVTNPGTVLNCQSCHLPGTYEFPVDRNARAGVIADSEKAAFLAGTGVNSGEASVCLSCHEPGE